MQRPEGQREHTAVTVADPGATTGCGLALQLAEDTYLVPTGSTWTDFHSSTGQELLVGYRTDKNDGDEQKAAPPARR